MQETETIRDIRKREDGKRERERERERERKDNIVVITRDGGKTSAIRKRAMEKSACCT